jgi:hypothetical protein
MQSLSAFLKGHAAQSAVSGEIFPGMVSFLINEKV